jgi:hypothetical protein
VERVSPSVSPELAVAAAFWWLSTNTYSPTTWRVRCGSLAHAALTAGVRVVRVSPGWVETSAAAAMIGRRAT